MASYTISPIWGAGAQLFDNSGNVLTGGKIYTYLAGTTTPATTYTTPIGTVANSNPIVANAAGRLTDEIWFPVSGSYKFVLKDANDVLLATYDNIPTTPQPPIVNDASSVAYESGYEVTAGGFTVGATYLITSVGTTDFVAIGAAANVTGIHFTATGVGSGTGTAEYSRTVQAKLRETVSVKDFGAVGDGVTDDTAAIQAALDSGNQTIYFPDGVYMVDAVTGLVPSNNQSLILADNAELQAITNSSDTYNVILLQQKSNVVIRGGKITGDRATHTGTTGEFGMGIGLYECQDITIEDCYISQCWGDGIYVGDDDADAGYGWSTNVIIKNCTIYKASRNGISITGGDNVQVIDCEISYSDRTNPKCGIDIEPIGSATDTVATNIVIKGCYFHHQTGGIATAGTSGSIINRQNLMISNNRFAYNNVHVGVGNLHKNVIVSNNLFEEWSAYAGVSQQYGATGDEVIGLVYTGNTTRKYGTVQFGGVGCSQIVVSGNSFNGNRITINGGDDVSIIGNTIVNPQGYGIYAAAGTTYTNLMIANNTISGNEGGETGNPGIYIRGGTPNECTIIGNTIRTDGVNQTTGIDCRVAGSLIVSNNLYNSGTSTSISAVTTGIVGYNIQNDGTYAPRYATVTYDPPSLADGDGVTTTVTVAKAALGDFAAATFSNDLQGITLTAWVSAADTVSIRFQNESGGTVDLASGTLRVNVLQVA